MKTRSSISEALGGSVSFGRFLSQSLDWGKWSSFCQKSYLEEIERCSTPGSVAEKKAFFEAHYRKSVARKSVTLLEQDNARASRVEEYHEENNADCSKVTLNGGKEPNLSEEQCELEVEDKTLTQKFLQIGALDIIDDDIENQSRVNVTEFGTTKPLDKHPLKESSLLNQEKRDSPEKRKRFPMSGSTVTHLRETNPTSNGKKKEVESESNENKKSTIRSLHMSINFSQECRGGTNRMMKITSPILSKVEGLKVVSSSLKSIQNSSNVASTRESLNGVKNPRSVTSESVDGRSGMALDKRLSGRAKVDASAYSVGSSKSISNHLRSQTALSSLSLRIAERVEKRKEEKAETDIMKLRQSINFKARPLPDFYRNREPPKIAIKKISQRKSNGEVCSSSLPPRQPFKSNQSTRLENFH